MNVTEAGAVGTLLHWITGTSTAANHVPPADDDARAAAEFLAERAYRALNTGMRTVDVREHWPAERDRPAAAELSDYDRHILRKVAAVECEDKSCPCPDWKRGLADLLRDDNPHLSDAELARVLLKTAGYISTVAYMQKLCGTQAAAVISGAAVELAALEIGDIHP